MLSHRELAKGHSATCQAGPLRPVRARCFLPREQGSGAAIETGCVDGFRLGEPAQVKIIASVMGNGKTQGMTQAVGRLILYFCDGLARVSIEPFGSLKGGD